MKSILVAALPRSLSGRHVDFTSIATGIKKASDVDQMCYGCEVLNSLLVEKRVTGFERKFTDDEYAPYEKALKERTEGWLIKDVVQPFILERYLRENPDDFNAIYVKRYAPEIAFCQVRKMQNHYRLPRAHPDYRKSMDPHDWITSHEDTHRLYLESIAAIRAATPVTQQVTVNAGDLLAGKETLFDVLEGYGYPVTRFEWTTPEFRAKLDESRDWHGWDDYKKIVKTWEELCACPS